MKLTVPFVAKAPAGRHGDGNGLYLLVKPTGRKTWVFRFRDRLTKKLRDKGLGPFPDIKLAEARELAAGCRTQLRRGVDPIASRKAELQRAISDRAKRLSFGECATRFISANKHSWGNAKHADQWEATIRTYCASLLSLPVSEIETAHVLDVLTPIWYAKTETASRLRARMERVLDWAKVSGLRSGENPARWKGCLVHLLPEPEKLKNVRHRPALPYQDVPAFMANLIKRQELSSLALQLQILTATRPGEAVGARWEEFDLAQRLWTIPPDRTKTRTKHEVPLTDQVISLLDRVPRSEKPYLFPGRPTRSLVTASTLKTLRAVPGGEDQTCHGFRSSFRDWAADQTSHEREVIEMALAHKIMNKTEAAYQRGTMIPKRRALMADWGKYCLSC